MLTCLCDAFFGEVGIATVKVLEHAGCKVEFDERQTCCGQPPFNSGDWESARKMAAHAIEVLDGEHPIVTPSGSCAAMFREGYHMVGGLEMKTKVYELCEFLHQVVKVKEWPTMPSPRRVGFHRSCHGRMLGTGDTQERILSLVGNLTVVLIGDSDQCCGFGGAFSISHSATSRHIGLSKIDQLVKSGISEVVSGDMGCLMHLDGLAKKEGIPLKFTHIAEVLASAL